MENMHTKITKLPDHHSGMKMGYKVTHSFLPNVARRFLSKKAAEEYKEYIDKAYSILN